MAHGKTPLKLGILASGTGTNLQAIIDACASGRLDAMAAVVVSDNPDAPALQRAKRHGIPAVVHPRERFDSRKAFEEAILHSLREHGVGLVCLAGFMRLIGKTLLAAFPNRIVNIHPALLPAFPGLHAQRQAFDYGVKRSEERRVGEEG